MVLSPSNVSITIALLYCLAYFIKKKKPNLSVNWNIIVCAVKQHPFQSKNKVHRNDKVGVLTRLSLSHTISCWFKLSLWNLCKSHQREFVSEFWRKRRKGGVPPLSQFTIKLCIERSRWWKIPQHLIGSGHVEDTDRLAGFLAAALQHGGLQLWWCKD